MPTMYKKLQKHIFTMRRNTPNKYSFAVFIELLATSTISFKP